ncbi:InlB B-repeat-containing protein [Candidatus Allofournierella excrementavium]|uniref:InlB B-repeat-containing protein n=1 Tax=Candidatus Allofournierella excrementavium TaxID=2838591 RepID=UPI003AF960C0
MTTTPLGAFADNGVVAAAQTPVSVSTAADEETASEALNNEEEVGQTPTQEAPVEETPAEETPAEEVPAEETPAEETPAEETPAEETPEEEAPAEETPEEETPAEETSEEETPAEETPEEETPAEETPAEETPAEEAPAEETPEEEAPAEETPEEEAPAEETPVEKEPVQLTGTAEDGTAYTVEGVLPEGAAVEVAPLEDRTALESQIGALLGEGQSLNALVVYDVTIVDAEGAAVQPEEPVTVTMALPEAGENQTVVMFHQKADGTLETAEAGVGTLEVSSFSPIGYYVAETVTPALASRADYINAEPKEIEVGKSFGIRGELSVTHEWSISGGEGVVSLQSDGRNATVIGVGLGTATITVSHTYLSFFTMKTDTYKYTVTVIPAKVTLTYNVNTANGGSGTAPAAVNGEAGDVVPLPSMDGQGFIGWSTSAAANNGTSENYKQTIYPAGYSYILPAHDVTLYAIWVKDYNANATFFIRLDGTIPREPAEYDGEYYTAGIVVDGAIKQGKFVVDSTGKAVKDNLNKQPTDDQIKQAVQAAGKTYDPATQYILWYVIKQEDDGYHVDGVILDKNKYNVTYDPNALVGQYTGKVPNGRQYVEGASVTVEGQGTLSRTGYTFLGWAEDKNATTAKYKAGDTFTMPGKDVDLYAVWHNTQTYEITVELYAGEPGSSTRLNSKNEDVNWTRLNDYKNNYSAAKLAKEMWGYDLTDDSGLYTVQWEPGALKEDVHDYVVRIYVDEESPDLVTVSYDANGGVGTVPESTILVKGEDYSPVASDDGLTKTNHEFIGWNTQADGKGVSYAAGATIPAVNADTTLYAQWKVKAFTITYVAGAHGSVRPANETVNAGENAQGSIAIPETGYKFVKWTDKNGEKVSESATFAPEKVLADAIYTAHFEPKDYKVTYSWTGAPDSVTKPADQTVKFGEPYTIDSEYTSATVVVEKDAYGNVTDRYTFSGWTDPNNGVMKTEGVNVTGSWTHTEVEVPEHSVNYSWDGEIPEGVNLPESITGLVKGQPYEIDDDYTSLTVVEVKDAYGNVTDRYTFSGWTDPNNGEMGEADVKVTGTWTHTEVEVPEYTITYWLDGAVYGTDTAVYNQPISIMADPADREGYTFSGWTVVGYPDGLPATMPAKDLKVEGTFIANNYDYTVNHIYLDRSGTELGRDSQTGSAAYDTQITYDKGLVFEKQNYLFSHDDGPKTIGIDAKQNVLNVYYDIDALVDPGRDADGDAANGDGIADKYQVIVTFEAVHGNVRPKEGTVEDEVKSLSTVVTLLDENGSYAEDGIGHLTSQQIPVAIGNGGYTLHGPSWKPKAPSTDDNITEDMTYVVSFRPNDPSEPVQPTPTPAPVPTPVPPVTPGTVDPEDPDEETPETPEEIVDEETPQAPTEETGENGETGETGETETVEEEDVPLAGPVSGTWALLNLILAVLTALGSVLLLIGYFGKKEKNNGEYTVNKKGAWRVFSLIPAIGAIVAFILTENMGNSMVFTDRWTLLMVVIAVVQVIVAILAKKDKEKADEDEAQA